MFRIFVRLLLVIAAIIAVILAIGACLPRSFDVAVERNIAAAPEAVFAEISDLRNWSRWTAWNPAANPHLQIEYGPRTSGPGASQSWSDPRGSGKVWITGVEEGRKLVYQSRFGRFPEMTSQIEITPREHGSRVRWTSRGRLPGGAFYGYFRGIFAAGLQREYNSNLTALEQVLTRPPESSGAVSGPDGQQPAE